MPIYRKSFQILFQILVVIVAVVVLGAIGMATTKRRRRYDGSYYED